MSSWLETLYSGGAIRVALERYKLIYLSLNGREELQGRSSRSVSGLLLRWARRMFGLLGWLVGLKSYCYFTLLRGTLYSNVGSRRRVYYIHMYMRGKYKYLLIVFYIYVTVLWALFAYNGFANYRHMCITVWQVRVGLALVKDTYLLYMYIYIYCTTVIHNT